MEIKKFDGDIRHSYKPDDFISVMKEYTIIDYQLNGLINNLYNFIAERYKSEVDRTEQLTHVTNVAYRLAKWELLPEVVLAGMLHNIIYLQPETLEIIRERYSEEIASILDDYKIVHNVIKQRENDEEIENLEEEYLSVLYPAAFYVAIADRMDDLNRYIGNKQEVLAINTEEFFLSEVEHIHANKIVEEITDKCLLILKPSLYTKIFNAVHSNDLYDSNNCLSSLNAIKNAFVPEKEDKNMRLSESIIAFKPWINSIISNERSISSYKRSMKSIDEKDESFNEALKVLRNKYLTPHYDITLILNDSKNDFSVMDSNVLFIEYYKEILCQLDEQYIIEDKRLTSLGDCVYYVVSDRWNNKFRIFIRYESDYKQYLYGDKAFKIMQIKKESKPKITVYLEDGSEKLVDEGTTVLELAFIISTSLGLHFYGARINDIEYKKNDVNKVLHNKDKVIIYENKDKFTAKISWFRHMTNRYAIDGLIRYFNGVIDDLEKQIKQLETVD